MDETDFQILADLFEHPLNGPEAVAREVGLTRNAVARRIRILRSGPPWLRFHALPHHTLFRRTSIVNLYATRTFPDAKEILACPDVFAFDLNHDGLCAVTTWGKQGVARSPRLDAVMGGLPIAAYNDATEGPPISFISRIDWKVVGALLEDPRASATTLAKMTGLAARTCTRARARLLSTKAVRASIDVREDLAVGFPIFRAYVQGKPDDARIRGILGPEATVTDTVAEGKVWFARAATVGSIMVAVENLRKLPRVTDVKLILSREAGVAKPRIREWCLEAESPAKIPE